MGQPHGSSYSKPKPTAAAATPAAAASAAAAASYCCTRILCLLGATAAKPGNLSLVLLLLLVLPRELPVQLKGGVRPPEPQSCKTLSKVLGLLGLRALKGDIHS